jgi:hypothetical protein
MVAIVVAGAAQHPSDMGTTLKRLYFSDPVGNALVFLLAIQSAAACSLARRSSELTALA